MPGLRAIEADWILEISKKETPEGQQRSHLGNSYIVMGKQARIKKKGSESPP